MSKKGTIDKENGMIKWTLLVDRREITMKNLSIADTIGDHQQMIKGIEVYNGEWSSANTYKRRDKLSDDAYQVNYSDNGFDLKFNDTVSNLVVIDYYTKITDTELIDQNYHFKNKAVMEWGGGTSGGKNSEEANGKVYEKVVNGGSGTGDLSSSSSSNSSSSDSSSDVDSSSNSSSSDSSSDVDSSSNSSSSDSSSDVDSSSNSSSSDSSSDVDSSSNSSSSDSSSDVDSSSNSSSSDSSSDVDSSSNSSNSSTDVNTGSESSDNMTTEPDNGHQTGDIEDSEDNTAVYPDIDEDTGTIDVDGGFDSNYDGSTTSNSTNSSKPLKDSTSSVFTSTPANTTTGQDGAGQTPTADTKKSSAKTTVSESDALTPSTPNQVAKLPQTNEAKMDSQALRSVGILLGVLTLGGGALIRHWF
nr:collagen binding domain-containing protein [Lactiplantibacillus plantarum]